MRRVGQARQGGLGPLVILLVLAGAFAAAPSASAADYVAMGDSYSSGTGTREYGPTKPDRDCERGPRAYAPLIAPGLPVDQLVFVACGGAQTANITTSGQHGQPPQATALSPATTYSTLSIGGNDAGFTDVLVTCGDFWSDCDARVDEAQAFIRGQLPARLDSTYRRIRQEAPNARVGVVGYPRIFPANGNDCSAGTFFSADEMRRLNETADLLADVTRARARAHGFTFVDARFPFLGHAWCEDAWLNGLSNPVGESFHPNVRGHEEGYAPITLAALLAAPAPAIESGLAGRIAFVSLRSGNEDIWTINADGTFPVNLTGNPAFDRDPAFSPDGTRIAFASTRGQTYDIYVAESDGSSPVQITQGPELDQQPAWSPDGEFIAFSRNGNLFKVPSTGGSAIRLSDEGAAVPGTHPDWSPDGAEIAFVRSDDVYKVNADGQGAVPLAADAAVDGAPAWSPDGSQIAFHSARTGGTDVYVMSATGGAVTRRTTNAAADMDPTWSPSGAQIAFQSTRNGNPEIYVMSATGGSEQRRTVDGSADTAPTWQGDSAPPETVIAGGPSGPTSVNNPTFTFDSTEPGSTFECSLDDAPFAPCPSPYTTPVLADGEHSLRVQATDPSGNTDLTPAARTFSVDTTPGGTQIDSGPSGLTNDPTPTFAFSSPEPGTTFRCRVDGGDFTPCSSPFTATAPGGGNLSQGEHTFAVHGTDALGNPDPAPVTRTFIVDSVAPGTELTSRPEDFTSDTSPTFEFFASRLASTPPQPEPGATFECSFDSSPFAPCQPPVTWSDLPDGTHVFRVRAVDAAGNRDASPGRVEFNVDTIPPETDLAGQPSGLTNNNHAAFTFTSPSDPGASFQCRFDAAGNSWEPCISPWQRDDLEDGAHVLEVRAVDRAGNADPTPAVREFNVDTTPPDTLLDSAPGGPTKNDDPTFVFSANEEDAHFECSLDSAPFGPCQSPLTKADLSEGSHTFRVRAIDGLDNPDPSPAQTTLVVDTVAPETIIETGPSGVTDDSTPTFAFSSDEAVARFECSVDGGAFAACASPHTLGALGDGPHTFTVRAVDQAGNDHDPASRSFTVDTTRPDTIIDSGPPPRSPDRSPRFSFSSPDGGVSFECSLDAGSFTSCTSPAERGPLGAGGHSFQVRSTDAAGNTDDTPAAFLFTIVPADVDPDPDPNPDPGPGPGPSAACSKVKRGGPGADRLLGTAQGDRLLGLGGKDMLRGRGGRDCLLGARGDDRLEGGGAEDRLAGGPGSDRLLARDGRKDRVYCGPGRDTAVIDPADVVRGCEIVRRPR